MFKTPLLSFKIPFSTVYKQKNPIYGATKPFFGFFIFFKMWYTEYMKSLKMLVLCRYNVECCNNGRFSNEFNAYFFHLFPPCYSDG